MWGSLRARWERSSPREKGVVALFVAALVAMPLLMQRASSSLAVESVATRDSRGRVDVRELLAAGVQLTQVAGERIVAIHRDGQLEQSSKGSLQNNVDNPLTKADMESHRILVSHLEAAFPGVAVVSEEHDGALPRPTHPLQLRSLWDRLPAQFVDPKDVHVWVDPLDATKEFTESLTQYVTVMACVVVRGEPVAGVIRFPFRDVTLWAWAGHGANFEAAPAPKGGDGKLRVIISRSHAGDITSSADQLGVGSVTPAGGAGYKVGEVLAGTQDAYIHKTRIQKWDVCAGDALLRAVGGRMTDWAGRDFDYGNPDESAVLGGVAAAVHNHKSLIQGLSQFDFDALVAANSASRGGG